MRIIIGHRTKGFAIIGVVVALAMLAAMGAGLAALVASNQRGRTATRFKEQNYYISHAALEYSLRNTKGLHNCSFGSRQLLGTDFNISISSKISSTSSYGSGGMVAGDSFSIAGLVGSNPGPCIIVLATSGSGAMTLTGNTQFHSICTVNVNSSSSTALTLGNNTSMTVTALNLVGGYSAGSGSSITGTIKTGATPTTDPFLSIPMISYSNTCTYTSFTVSGTATLNPGTYCLGLSISGNGTITLNPGNYIIDGGTFSVTGSPKITGNGVTIFLNQQIQASYATMAVSGSGTFNLTAPTSGTYKGIAIYQSRNAPAGSNTIAGSSGANINGAIYLPNQSLTFSGSTSSSAICTLPITKTLAISGPTNITCAAGDLGGLIGYSC